MPHSRIQIAGMVAALVVFQAILPQPVAAEIGDISVGGVWICRLTQGASGMTLPQRVTQVNQRITEVLSLPEPGRPQIIVEVRPVGTAAAIVVADITIMTVIPEDAGGTGMAAHEVANQWAARLAQGLQRALPGREVIAKMFAPQPPVPRLKEARWLTGITWYWQSTLMNDGSQFVPDDRRRYTVVFSHGGRVAVRADCNRGVGRYVLNGRALAMSALTLTKAACPPGSLERHFLAQLNDVGSLLRRRDRLHLEFKYDSGTMSFGKVFSEERLTGTVTYRQRIALPPDAVINVQLLDASKAELPPLVLGQEMIAAGGRQVPLAFELKYDSHRISSNAIVVVRATIVMGGRVLFTTTTVQRAITGGYPSKGIEVVVEPVR